VPRYCQETAIGPGESFGLLSTRLPAKGSDDGHTQSEPSQARSERSDDGDKRSEPSQPQSEPSQSAVAARAGSQEAKRGTVCFLNVAVPEGDLERKGMEDVLNPDVIGSVIFGQHLLRNVPPGLNGGCHQSFLFTYHHGLMIAGRRTLVQAIEVIMEKTWKSFGSFQVAN
jgi:hypothetical protein